MHIAIFSSLYMPHLGGVEKYTQSLAAELASDNEVTVFTLNTNRQPDLVREGNVSVYFLPCIPAVNARFPIPLPAAFPVIRGVLKDHPADFAIVQCRFYLFSAWAVSCLGKQKVPFIQLEHGAGGVPMPNRLMDLGWKLYENTLTEMEKKVPHSYYGVSQAAVEHLKEFGIEGEGVITNPLNPADFDEALEHPGEFRKAYGIPDDKILITFSGRIMEEKGITDLLRAYDLARTGDTILIAAGGGDMELIREWQDRPDIRFTGHLPFPEVVRLMVDSDIFCIPSRFVEGGPTALLEAGYCHTAVIASDNGGPKEYIRDRESGLLVTSGSVPQIAEALRTLIADAALRQRYADALQQTIFTSHTRKNAGDTVRAILRKYRIGVC